MHPAAAFLAINAAIAGGLGLGMRFDLVSFADAWVGLVVLALANAALAWGVQREWG